MLTDIWEFLDGKKTMFGLVLYAVAAVLEGIEQLTGAPLGELAKWVRGTGEGFILVGASHKIKKEA